MPYVDVGARRIEYERIEVAAGAGPTLVFLHEGLGSVAMWRDFPGRVAHATGCNALVVLALRLRRLRAAARGPARSATCTTRRWSRCRRCSTRSRSHRPILVGHSDGGSIALIHAGGARRPLAGLVADGAARDGRGRSRSRASPPRRSPTKRPTCAARLARYHADVDSAFRGWNRIWLAPGVPRLEHRGVPARASPARCWRSRARTTNTGRWSSCGGSGAQVRDVELVALRRLPALAAQGSARGGAGRDHAVRRPDHVAKRALRPRHAARNQPDHDHRRRAGAGAGPGLRRRAPQAAAAGRVSRRRHPHRPGHAGLRGRRRARGAARRDRRDAADVRRRAAPVARRPAGGPADRGPGSRRPDRRRDGAGRRHGAAVGLELGRRAGVRARPVRARARSCCCARSRTAACSSRSTAASRSAGWSSRTWRWCWCWSCCRRWRGCSAAPPTPRPPPARARACGSRWESRSPRSPRSSR